MVASVDGTSFSDRDTSSERRCSPIAVSSGDVSSLSIASFSERSVSHAGKSAVTIQAATTQSQGPKPTRFLVYLNKQTFRGKMGEAFAQEVRDALAADLKIAVVHENDDTRDGCEFDLFFKTTPQDLIDGGLYRQIAIAFMKGEGHRKVGRALLAKNLGAEARQNKSTWDRVTGRGSVYELRQSMVPDLTSVRQSVLRRASTNPRLPNGLRRSSNTPKRPLSFIAELGESSPLSVAKSALSVKMALRFAGNLRTATKDEQEPAGNVSSLAT